jgi:hypothetical protein
VVIEIAFVGVSMNNHRKPWTKAQMVRLQHLIAVGISPRKAVSILGRSPRKAVSILGRSPGAIILRLQIINMANMINHGDDDDTLISWKKKLKEIK